MIHLPKIILASGSPRRSEILTSVGWKFEKQVPDIDETKLDGEAPEAYVRRLAASKAEAIAVRMPDEIVVGADTIVVAGEEILGKPLDFAEAKSMILRLSGRRHEVLTGIAVVCGNETFVEVQRTTVQFAQMTEAEIDFLAREGNPLDKAGAYAVQAQAALFIETIDGDYWNVVGLPVRLLYEIVRTRVLSVSADEI